MEMNGVLRIPMVDASQPGEARRLAVSYCRSMGLSEEDAGRVALIVTELATNLAKHANGGELLIQRLRAGAALGVEILSIDRGPGMKSLSRCLADGFSTSGGAGCGLGAVGRISSQFNLF